MPGPFALAHEFCEITGIALPSDLTRLQRLLQAASDLIRAECAQELSFHAADVVSLPEISRTTIVLPERPVTAISLVVVDGVTKPNTEYSFEASGIVTDVNDVDWSSGATVTYDHGYVETDWEFGVFRTICIQAAARAFTLNERSASEALGSTLMETAGYSPEVFLTPGEKLSVAEFGKVLIG